MKAMHRITEVAENVFLVSSDGFCSHSYVIPGPDGALVIDAGSGLSTEGIREAAKGRIARVVLTHGHADHIHGIDALGVDGELTPADLGRVKEINPFVEGYEPPERLKEISLDRGRVRHGALSLEVIRTPGHTPGSICLYDEKSGILFSGDTLFSGGSVGRTDLPGGSDEELSRSVSSLAKLGWKLLLPGHGRIEKRDQHPLRPCKL